MRRVGENKNRPINVRIVSATNKDLSVEVAEKRFREDLYYRLNVVELAVPPLRRRREDILPLARLLLAEAALQMKRPVDGLTVPGGGPTAWLRLARQRARAGERHGKGGGGGQNEPGGCEDLPPQVNQVAPPVSDKGEPRFLKDVEKDCILAALEKTDGNRRKAADLMGVGVATLYRKLKAYKLLDLVKD